MAPFVLIAAMLVGAAVLATASRGFRTGVWKLPLAVFLSVGLFGLTVWESTNLDSRLRYWGNLTLADEWQAEVKSHMSELTEAVFPGSELQLLPDHGPQWCGVAVSEALLRTVRWEITNAVPVPGKVDEARTWLLDNYPSYSDPYTASDGKSFSVDTPRGGELTLYTRSGAPIIWWDSPCIGRERVWWLPASQIALIVLLIATAGFTVLWWRGRHVRRQRAAEFGA